MINRRQFIRSLTAAIIGANAVALIDEDRIIRDTAHLSDNDFVTYMTFSINLYINNPGYSAIITNIGED